MSCTSLEAILWVYEFFGGMLTVIFVLLYFLYCISQLVKMMNSREILSNLRKVLQAFDYIIFAILYGSRATGLNTQESDFDIAICTNRNLTFDDQIELISKISKCLGVPEDKIDILLLNDSVSLELRYKVFRDGILIFARDENAYKKFRDCSISLYLDYKMALEKINYSKKYLRKVREMLNGVKRTS